MYISQSGIQIYCKTIAIDVCLTLYHIILCVAGQSIVLVSHELQVIRINMYSRIIEASVSQTKFMQPGPYHGKYVSGQVATMTMSTLLC